MISRPTPQLEATNVPGPSSSSNGSNTVTPNLLDAYHNLMHLAPECSPRHVVWSLGTAPEKFLRELYQKRTVPGVQYNSFWGAAPRTAPGEQQLEHFLSIQKLNKRET